MTATISGATRMAPAQLVSIANALARTDDAIRARVALVAVSTLAAVLYLWDLTVSGYANTYYSMAAQAASQSWSAWFFGSLDAGGFITLDKPPLATMLMGLSVRVLGLSPLTVLLPQALLGVATVGLLFLIVRGSFGTVAATIAAVVMALTPVAVLIYRYDNPDALLTFLLVASAGTLLRAIETGRGRWLVATGALIGAAFLTKYLQAYLVVPGFVFAYLVAARGSLRRRLAEVVGLGVVTLAASAWWVAAVELIPASSRPYIGGSTGNSVLDLIFGYDGLGRIFGIFGFGPGPAGPSAAGAAGQVGGGPAGPSGAGGGFGGAPGLLRMFNDRFAGQIAWFLPASVCGLAAGIWARRRAGRRDRRLAAYLVWGSWLVTTVLVFSLMSGIIHSYYTVALAPAVAALAGAGAAEVWPRRRHPLARVGLAASIAGTGALAAALLSATPAFAPGLGFAILAVAVAAALVLVLPDVSVGPAIPRIAAAAAVVALLAGPAAYAGATIATAHSGGDPSAGPVQNAGPGGFGAPGVPPAFAGDGLPPIGAALGGFAGGIGPGGGTGGPGASLGQDVVDHLVANRGSARWLVAVASSNEAAPIQLATGIPVMAMGGFSGSDAALTIDQLRTYVSSGQLRFIVVDGRGAGAAGSTASSSIASWVTSCSAVSVGGVTTAVYDCSGAG